MSTVIAPSFTQRVYTWTNWKAVQSSKNLIFQYDDDGTLYTIWGYDQPEVHLTNIWKGTVPDSIVNSGYSQAQNDSDKTDFESNYKNNANKRISNTDKFGNPIVTPFDLASGFNPPPTVSSSVASGYVGLAALSNTATVIRATAYTAQGANSRRSISSTSALDHLTGSGARTVRIKYLSTSLDLYKTEDINMSGGTANNTINTDIAFLESMEVISAGSTGGNQGTINFFVTSSGGGGIWGSIAAQDNKTFWAHHYILSGTTCYLLNVMGGAISNPGQINIQTQGNPVGSNLPQKAFGSTYLHGSEAGNSPMIDHAFVIPLAIPGPNFVWLTEKANGGSGTGNTAYGSFEFVQM